MKKGFSLIETLTVAAITVILVVVVAVNLVKQRNQTSLRSTASSMAAVLREAQSRSVSQASSTSWGVRFENFTNVRPAYVLFSMPYSTSSRISYYSLPIGVSYVTTYIRPGSYADVFFSQLSGNASGSSTIAVYLNQGGTIASSTITISRAGSVSY